MRRVRVEPDTIPVQESRGETASTSLISVGKTERALSMFTVGADDNGWRSRCDRAFHQTWTFLP
jgi:hypothetical protein